MIDDEKISELPVATSVASPDVVPVVQGGVTKQADVSLVAGTAPLHLHSTGDSNDIMAHPYTLLTTGIYTTDLNNVEVLRFWAGNPDTGSNDGNARSLFIGANAGNDATTHDSVAVGFNALSGGDIAFGNTAVGSKSLQSINDVNSDENTAIGYQALQGLTTGYENTAVGYQAGAGLQSGIDNVLIGASTNAGAGVFNSIVIGASVNVGVENTAIIGNGQLADAYFGGTSGNAILHGKGDAIVFPDSDPHIVGAGYWSAGILTRSNG